MLKVHCTAIPNYVARVNYKEKGMTKRARELRRIDPRSLPESCPYDNRFHTIFQFNYYTSVILSRNPVVAKS